MNIDLNELMSALETELAHISHARFTYKYDYYDELGKEQYAVIRSIYPTLSISTRKLYLLLRHHLQPMRITQFSFTYNSGDVFVLSFGYEGGPEKPMPHYDITLKNPDKPVTMENIDGIRYPIN